jgi:effector-binding domain-containing protein
MPSGSLVGAERQASGDQRMPSEPVMKERDAQSYVAIRKRAPRESLNEILPGLFGEIFEWVGKNGITIAGSPLIRYLVVDYNTGEVEVDIGVPVASKTPKHPHIHRGEIPGGTYATVLHQGDYAGLKDTTAELLAWGEENHIQWQVSGSSNVTHWSGRIEHYLVSPPKHTNPADWRTEVAILLAKRK